MRQIERGTQNGSAIRCASFIVGRNRTAADHSLFWSLLTRLMYVFSRIVLLASRRLPVTTGVLRSVPCTQQPLKELRQ